MKKAIQIFFVCISAICADWLYLNNGEMIQCRIVSVTHKQINYIIIEDELSLPRSKVNRIKYSNGLIVNIEAPLPSLEKSTTNYAHDGLYFSFLFAAIGSEIERSDFFKEKGFGYQINVAVGYTFFTNLVTAITAQYVRSVPNKSNETSLTFSPDVISHQAVRVGPEFKYYFMPINIYFSAAPLVAWQRTDYNSINAASAAIENLAIKTGPGLGLYLALGYESFVSKDFAIGINLFFARTIESNSPIRNFELAFGLGLSVVYN